MATNESHIAHGGRNEYEATPAVEGATPGDAFDHELKAFESLLPSLLQTKPGKYVAIYQGRLIDEDADEFALARRMERAHRSEVVLIRRVATDAFTHLFLSPTSGEA